MIPFEHTWPYDIYRHDIYVHECPFCQANHVLLPLKKEDLAKIRAGAKRRLVFPCCGHSVVIVDLDDDYLLADQPLRR
jgi:hypothetical protein